MKKSGKVWFCPECRHREEYISHGWWMPCANPKCGNDHLDEESLSKGAGIIDHKIYCPECYLKMKEKS